MMDPEKHKIITSNNNNKRKLRKNMSQNENEITG